MRTRQPLDRHRLPQSYAIAAVTNQAGIPPAWRGTAFDIAGSISVDDSGACRLPPDAMPPDTAALLTFAGLAGFALAYLARQFTDAGGWAIWVLSWFFRCFCVLRLSHRMQGPCPLPIHGGALVVGNHRSRPTRW